MTNSFVARRAVARWAVRMFRREWRQQLLVLALLTVTIGVAVFAASAAYAFTPSRDGQFGSANHRLEVIVSNPDALEPYLGAAQEWFGTIDVFGHRDAAVPGSTERVEIRAQDPNGAYSAPMLELRSGRYPTAADEAALTDEVAALVDADIGDSVALGGATLTVVGLVENPGNLDEPFALVAPAASGTPDVVTILVDASGDRVDAFTFAEEPGGGYVDSRGTVEKTAAAVIVFALATVVMLLVTLVAAAGFVVVAQRRQRQLGMLAAIGATQRHLRFVMLANGAAVGLFAGVIGTAVALLAWVTAASSFENAAGHRIDRFDVPWWLVGTGVLLAVVTATAAAWWPARSAARLPVTLALSARPPRPKATHRPVLVAALLFVIGVTCLAFGVNPAKDSANPWLLLPGVVATVAALLFLASPAIRALAGVAGRLPVAVRLSLRDLARYQARSGAALAAISLGLAIAVAAVVIAAAREYRADEGNLSDRQVLIRIGGDFNGVAPEPAPADVDRLESSVDEFARTLDDPAVLPLQVALDPTVAENEDVRLVRPTVLVGRPVGENTLRDAGLAWVATPELLDHLGIDSDAVEADTILLTPQTGDVYLHGVSNTTFRRNPVPADRVQRIDTPAYSSAPRSLLTERGLEEGGWTAAPAGWLIETREPFTDAQLAAARAMAADAGLTVETRDEQGGLGTVRSVASAVGVLLALGILAMTVGLIRGESARELRTLTATGAASHTRRALTASTAGALALLGVILAITTTYLALVAGYWPDAGRLTRIPVAHLTAIAVGLPLIATGASWLLAGREQPGVSRAAIE